MEKITSMNQLIKELDYETIDIVFCNYIEYYINNGFLLKEIQNKHNNELVPNIIYANPGNAYKYNYIHCNVNEYETMTKFLQEFGDYEYAVPNKEFISYMIDSAGLGAYWDYFPGDDIIDVFKSFNKSIQDKNPISYKTILSLDELSALNDEINDKIRIKDLSTRQEGTTVLYINGSILADKIIHEELLTIYNEDYKNYEKEWIVNLNEVEMPLSWSSCTELNIPCARLFLNDSNICELLVLYAGDLYDISHAVAKKFNCKVYTYDSSINLFIKTGKKKKIIN